MSVGKRVGTGTEESKVVEKALGYSTDVLGSSGSWHKPCWGPGCVQRIWYAMSGVEKGIIAQDLFRRDQLSSGFRGMEDLSVSADQVQDS